MISSNIVLQLQG